MKKLTYLLPLLVGLLATSFDAKASTIKTDEKTCKDLGLPIIYVCGEGNWFSDYAYGCGYGDDDDGKMICGTEERDIDRSLPQYPVIGH